MLRRLLAQLGLTTLLMALGAGAVLADAAPATTPPSTDPGQTVISTDTTSVTVNTSHTSTTSVGTSVGGSTDGDNSNGNPPATTPPAGNSSGNGLNSDSGSTTKASNPSTNSPIGSTNSTVTPSQAGGSSSTSMPTTAASNNSLVASLQRVAFISGLTPIAPITAAPIPNADGNHAPPSPPPAPVGLLYQLHVLLISTLVPAVRFVPDIVKAAATSQAGLSTAIVLVLSCLALLELTVPANSYPARLRRSGFLGAARSDVAPLLLFATPREMSSIGAGALG